jgi:hypothetical protein
MAVFGDILNVAGRIKQIEKALTLKYEGEGRWNIYQKLEHGQEVAIMPITRAQLHFEECINDKNIVEYMREIIWRNRHTDVLAEMDKANEMIEKEKERAALRKKQDLLIDLKAAMKKL